MGAWTDAPVTSLLLFLIFIEIRLSPFIFGAVYYLFLIYNAHLMEVDQIYFGSLPLLDVLISLSD